MPDSLFGGKAVIQFQHEHERRGFLKYAALVGVGGALATGVAPVLAASSSDQFGSGDVGILNYALTLEYLESTFYAMGVQQTELGDNRKYIEPIAAHEAAHVQAITATLQKLSQTPVSKPRFKFPDGTFTDPQKFLKIASTFEETGVKAYHGQVTLIQSGDILAAAASIAGVESRHASVLNLILGQKPVLAPVEAHASMDEILAIVKPFIG
ncbi:MAG: ferritin-like domain-containing protein [Candidatus Dormibacteraceae bacterium]